MITILSENYYSIDELVAKTGYQKNTLYNFTSDGIISKPVRGLTDEIYPSGGLYKEVVLSEIKRYTDLKLQGLKRRDIILLLNAERTNDALL